MLQSSRLLFLHSFIGLVLRRDMKFQIIKEKDLSWSITLLYMFDNKMRPRGFGFKVSNKSSRKNHPLQMYYRIQSKPCCRHRNTKEYPTNEKTTMKILQR